MRHVICNLLLYVLLTKGEVKMAGYWPSSLLHFYGLKDKAIKEQGQYPAILTEQSWSIKDLLYG